MKQKFLKQLEDVANSAEKFIKKNVKEFVVLATLKQCDEESELLYNLPLVFTVGKYGQYDEYAIIKVENRSGNIILHTIGTTEGEQGTTREFDLSSIDNLNICFLADEIELKNK